MLLQVHTAQEIMGHSTVVITLDLYSRMFPHARARLGDALCVRAVY